GRLGNIGRAACVRWIGRGQHNLRSCQRERDEALFDARDEFSGDFGERSSGRGRRGYNRGMELSLSTLMWRGRPLAEVLEAARATDVANLELYAGVDAPQVDVLGGYQAWTE